MGDNFVELVGAGPGDGEGADAAGGDAADGVGIGVVADAEVIFFFFDVGDRFRIQQEIGVGRAEGVVFEAAVLWFGAPAAGGFGELGLFEAGVDEQADEDGDFFFGD